MHTIQRAVPCCSRVADIALNTSARSTLSASAARRSTRIACASCRNRFEDRRNFSYSTGTGARNARHVLAVSRNGNGRSGAFGAGCQVRGKASAVEGLDTQPLTSVYGPMQEYDARVRAGRLRDDEHQRGRLKDMCSSREMNSGVIAERG